MKTINILGDTQREQWHGIVHMLRQLGGNLDYRGRSDLCDELDRYIDHCEDIFDEMRKEQEKPRTLCDRNGNAPRSAEEQERLVRWSQRNRKISVAAVAASGWNDEEDKEEFIKIIMASVAIPLYWAMDTLAREVFCDIIAEVKK